MFGQHTKIIVISSILLVLAISVISIVGYCGSIYNRATGLENQYKAQVLANKSVHDKMWKVLQQKAGVTQQYASDFKENFAAIMQNRYGNPDSRNNSMMLWIKEKNPEFSTDLYRDLSRSIEAYRNEFDIAQKKMIDIKRVHDDLRTQLPTSIILSFMGKTELEIKLVTSGRTESAFQTGEDNDVDLFKK